MRLQGLFLKFPVQGIFPNHHPNPSDYRVTEAMRKETPLLFPSPNQSVRKEMKPDPVICLFISKMGL